MLMLLFAFSLGEGIEGKPLDSLEVQRNQNTSFWKKLSFGIGYSGGLCWTGEDLAKPFEGSPIAGFYQLPEYLGAHLYWMNSIETSVTYPVNEEWGIEVGFGYGWTELGDRTGLESIYYKDSLSGKDYSIGTSGRWEVYNYNIKLMKVANVLGYGAELVFAYSRNKEGLWQLQPLSLVEEHKVTRYCLGGGILLKWEGKYRLSRSINLYPFLSVKVSLAKEIATSAPWTREYKDKLNLVFSGLYLGIKYKL